MGAVATPLKRLRRQAGYSVRALAARAGVSFAALWRIETGAAVARPATAKKIADALGVTIPDVTEFATDGGTDVAPGDHRPD